METCGPKHGLDHEGGRHCLALVLQHADDPVVWWDFGLIAQRPDWLAEVPGPAVSPRMTWLPVITFLQVTVDQFFGVNAPNGFGHNYSAHMAQTWADVVGVPESYLVAPDGRLLWHRTGGIHGSVGEARTAVVRALGGPVRGSGD